ncbi:MAG: hypothetical protein H7Z73_06370, partial [Candidatus Saccharibacteria bacterium]|nr:hypothetical protein [Moraxellaceae bacterium]
KNITTKFFQSMTPDVYSAIVFSFLTKTFVYSHEPLAINGASTHSGGTAGFEKVKRARTYDPAEKFWKEKNIPFHDDVPLVKSGRPVRSISVCVYEAFLQAERFHHLKPVKTSHVQQLKIAIEISGPDNDEVLEWANDFARKHNIKLPPSKRSPFRNSIKFVISRQNRFFIGLQSYPFHGTMRIGIKDVHEASLIAGMLKQLRPSIIKRVIQRFVNRASEA